jgi:hypothetical protein
VRTSARNDSRPTNRQIASAIEMATRNRDACVAALAGPLLRSFGKFVRNAGVRPAARIPNLS